LAALQKQTNELVRKLQQQPSLMGVSTQFRSNAPQLFMDIDREKVESLGMSVNDVNQTLAMYMGSLYVNSFNAFGRHWQVTIQAEGNYRSQLDGLNLLTVRNKQGQMVPLNTLFNIREIGGPAFVTRYNLSTAATVTGNLRPGVSSGEAIAITEALARETLPISMKTEWTELMFMQIRAGNTAIYVFLLAILCVFLALAALYESWSLPLAVILVVPLCLLCSVCGVLLTGSSVNIFVQIGLVVLVGLACKNAILIVEFARQLHGDGQPRFEATTDASKRRLRPILMTSFAFILGVVPLVIAEGAGAEMRRSLGTAVFSGMIGVTLFGIVLTPVFFYVIEGLGKTRLFASPRMHRVWRAVIIIAGIGALEIPALGVPRTVRFGALVIAVLGIPTLILMGIKKPPAGGDSSPNDQSSRKEEQ
jgi:multidrug efflux pump